MYTEKTPTKTAPQVKKDKVEKNIGVFLSPLGLVDMRDMELEKVTYKYQKLNVFVD